jgi:cytochrome c biogenesis protein CcmG/thiol:disulfide interchange protein DsbE
MTLHQPLRIFFSITFLTLLILFFFCDIDTNADPGLSAPGFNLQNLSGDSVSLKEHKGNPVLIDFWATWCPPCRRSIPELVELQARYRDQGLVVLGISLDDPGRMSDRDLETFKQQFEINYSILRANQQVLKDYFKGGEISIPTMFIIDRKGRIADVLVGFRPGRVENSLKKIIP